MSTSFEWTDAAVRRALGVEPGEGAVPEEAFTGVSTDTRTLEPGNLFVALRGPRFDGHDHLADARERGARGAVVSTLPEDDAGLALYPVQDTLVALGQLARFRRRALAATVVALTGSTGKTTVKDLLAAALGAGHRLHATRANRNNRVGLPLTLLAVPDDAELVVVEMGTSEPGEIGMLARIAEPDLALVTTVTEAHLDGLGSLEGVLEEKLALLAELRPGAPALVGDVPPELPRRARALREGVRVAGFSDASDPELRGTPRGADEAGRVPFDFRDRVVRPRLPGPHGAMNALLALGVCDLLDIPLGEAIGGVESVEPGPLRGEVRRMGGLTLVLDCYNANPQSVRAALEHLAAVSAAGKRVAVLGSMLELGERSAALHRDLLDQALALPLGAVVAVGAFRDAAAAREEAGRGSQGDGPVLLRAPDAEGAWDVLRPHLGGDEVVLLKGSRGVALEQMVPRFEAAFGASAPGSEPGAGGGG